MGISKDLKLVGNDFSNIATFLFVGLLCFEVPNSELYWELIKELASLTKTQFTSSKLHPLPSGSVLM